MQRDRRQDLYPWTWEIPAVVTIAAVLMLLCGLQLGRSLANLLSGAGWTWPGPNGSAGPGTPGASGSPLGREFWTSIPGILTGHADVGVPGLSAEDAAGPRLLLVCLVATELVLCAVAIWVAVRCLRRWGPGRLKGMATRSETETILGVTRLRKVAPMVRPDLYGKHASKGAATPAHTSTASTASTGTGVSDPAAQAEMPWVGE